MRIRTRKPLYKNAQLVFSATAAPTTKENPRHAAGTNVGDRNRDKDELNNLLQAVFGKRERESCLAD